MWRPGQSLDLPTILPSHPVIIVVIIENLLCLHLALFGLRGFIVTLRDGDLKAHSGARR